MYKVFFKDRTVTFSDDAGSAVRTDRDLVYRFGDPRALEELVDAFFYFERIGHLTVCHEDLSRVKEAFRNCFLQVEAGGGVVLNGSGEFLVIKRKGMWDLPKGKLEPDEDFETAAVREVEEETGLTGIRLIHPVVSTYHTYEEKGEKILKKIRWFRMQYDGHGKPRPQSSEGITDLRWVQQGRAGFIEEQTYPSIVDVLHVAGLL